MYNSLLMDMPKSFELSAKKILSLDMICIHDAAFSTYNFFYQRLYPIDVFIHSGTFLSIMINVTNQITIEYRYDDGHNFQFSWH